MGEVVIGQSKDIKFPSKGLGNHRKVLHIRGTLSDLFSWRSLCLLCGECIGRGQRLTVTEIKEDRDLDYSDGNRMGKRQKILRCWF